MNLANYICFGLILCGIVVFLFGANLYNEGVGWVGVYLFLVGFIALLALYVHGWLTDKNAQNP
jgi:hypothetical protein